MACGTICLSETTIKKIENNQIPKGDVLNAARIAGILAAKKTSQIIPLCHPLNLTYVEISFTIKKESIEITAISDAYEKTGVEMEALTAVSISALTIYDMCKMLDKKIVINNIYLKEKTGGKSDVKI
ncbi:MAG: cyclic pyranopterin monophosphate synthase MoaC [bacterium]